jgi:DNA-binding CsgD family transcriptional regulator/PAS domain-containing protein
MRDYETLVGAIYDCAANPELWPHALGLIKDAVGGAYALVGFIDASGMATGRPPFVSRHNSPWDEEWLLKLEARLASLPDGGGINNAVDEAWTQLGRTSESEFQTNDFYLKWVKPQGLRDTINTPYIQREGVMGMLSIPCYATREPYGAEECRIIERLSPHIRRAMMINDVADKGKMAMTLYRQVLDSLSVAVFIVGYGRRMVFCNGAADELLREDSFICLVNNTVHAKRAVGVEGAFGEAIDRALKGDVAVGISGIGVPLLDTNGDRAAAYVLPLAGDDVRGAMGHGHCVVFVARRGEQQPMAVEVLRTLFDLTAMEARVATLLAKGDGPALISQSLDISINTVRTHLKHAFAKTRTADQLSLGGLVNRLMPPTS